MKALELRGGRSRRAAGRAGVAEPRPETRRAPAGRLLLAAVLLIGLNLRGALAAVSPVLPELRADLGLSPSVAALVTTLPVLCFAAAAPAAAAWGRRSGARPAILGALVLLAAATVGRTLGGAAVLLGGTVAIGVAMTVGNVLLPAVVKREFGERAGPVTGLYTAALAAGAAATAALTAPVASAWGWRAGLAGWALLALVAAAVWRAATVPGQEVQPVPASGAGREASVWRHPVAWAVALLLAVQTFLYYAVTTWLPTVLTDRIAAGVGTAAAAASLFQLTGIAGALLVPALLGRRSGQVGLGRRSGQVGLGLTVAAGWVALFTGLLAWPAGWPLWVSVGGLAQGAGVALAFTLVVLRARDEAAARDLSGMSQLVGYALGATGPLLIGALYGVTGGWAVPLGTTIALGLAYGAAAAVAGRPVLVGADPARG